MTNLLSILSSAAKIPEQLKRLGKAEMAEVVLAVSEGAYVQIADNLKLREEINELKEKIREKDEEIRKLSDISSFRKEMMFKNDCYWGKDGQAYCSACLDTPNKASLVRMHSKNREDGFVICPICSNTAWSKGYKEESFEFQERLNSDPF